MNIKLHQLPKDYKIFLAAFIILLTFAVLTGLAFLYHTTNYEPNSAVEHFNGSEPTKDSDFEIPEKYAKPVSELLITTHNHFFGFAFIFLALGTIFYFNSTITGFWKGLLITEPLFSTLFTFGGIWLVRYIHPGFIYLTVISSTLIYLSFALMTGVVLYELLIKKERTLEP